MPDDVPEIFSPANTVLIGQDAIARRLGVTLKEAEALCADGTLKATREDDIWSASETDLAAYLDARDRPGTA